jgi:hypothetical protein
MATYEFDNRAAPLDQRPILVKGKRYHYATKGQCKVCDNKDNERPLYLKSKLQDDAVLECPVCETVAHTKMALVEKAE